MIHPIDRAAGWLFRYGSPSQTVFRAGWGDEQLLDAIDVSGTDTGPAAIEVVWAAERRQGDMILRDGTFPSPAENLPGPSQTASLRMVSPARPDGRLVVMMAAWNDHGYGTRGPLAALLASRGVTAVMLENPYYGTRRAWSDPPIRTVTDFALMGRGAVEEGRALLAYFARDHEVGVSGFSMGGNTAALAGALMDKPVAIAALAASHSPGPVWSEGLIRYTVDSRALGGDAGLQRLRSELSRATVLAVPPRPHTANAVIVGGSRDGYIPRHAVEDLHAHWAGSELRWLRAGHATMIWRHKNELVDAILNSFRRTFGD